MNSKFRGLSPIQAGIPYKFRGQTNVPDRVLRAMDTPTIDHRGPEFAAGVGHRRAYDPIATESYTVLTPGTNISDLRTLPFRRIHRPIFPLDTLPQ